MERPGYWLHKWTDETSEFDPHGRWSGGLDCYERDYSMWIPDRINPDDTVAVNDYIDKQFELSSEVADGLEVIEAADAQATIAALQAQLEQAQEERSKYIQAVGLASTCAADMQIDISHPIEMMQEVCKQLTQRTAELEAVNRVLEEKADCADLWYDEFLRIRALNASQEINGICDRALDGIKRNVPMVQENQQLHVELERVRALIKALPKVEKCFVTGQTFVQYKVAKAIYCLSFPDTEAANGFLALLQHRQGMEG